MANKIKRYARSKAKTAGLSPGTMVYTGEARADKARISIMSYDDTSFSEKINATVEDCLSCKNDQGVTWINVVGLHDLAVIEAIGKHFKLHPLIMEDIVHVGQRPKLDDFDDYIFFVCNILFCEGPDAEFRPVQVSLVIGKGFLISFQESDGGSQFEIIRERIRNNKGRLRKNGADYLAYRLLDSIIDNYFVLLERNGEKIEALEEEILAKPERHSIAKIHALKREMIFLRKSVWPLREVIAGIERSESEIFTQFTKVFLRDVYDHTIQVIDTVETYRDVLAGLLEVYLSSISHRLNEVMKVLTIIATIFIPLTFISSIYGMNFKNMPELEWHNGYFYCLIFMAGIGLLMLAYFRKRKWL